MLVVIDSDTYNCGFHGVVHIPCSGKSSNQDGSQKLRLHIAFKPVPKPVSVEPAWKPQV